MIFARWTFLPLLLSLENKDYDDNHDDDDDDTNDDNMKLKFYISIHMTCAEVQLGRGFFSSTQSLVEGCL